jgi:hypothetical protein
MSGSEPGKSVETVTLVSHCLRLIVDDISVALLLSTTCRNLMKPFAFGNCREIFPLHWKT